jgi:hypothetical protein
VLANSQSLAAIEKGRFLGQDLIEDGHGVVEIPPFKCRHPLLVLFSHRPRDLANRFLCHDASLLTLS